MRGGGRRRLRPTMTISERTPRAAAVYAAALACAIVLLVPWEPASFGGKTDDSWQLVLHDASARNVHFGEQLVFNYGPYGFAFCGYDPRTFGATLAIWLLIAVALAAGTLEIGRDAFRSPYLVAALVIAIAAMIAIQWSNNVAFIAL